MDLPWQLLEVGPGARWAMITIAPSCVASPHGKDLAAPTTVVRQTRSAIRIRAFARDPKYGHFGEKNCGGHWALAVRLPSAIDGRKIEGQSWPSRLRYGSFRRNVLGLPRLLGLSPAQALRVLWLEGFHARLAGRGRQVVAQIPGWGLTDRGTGNDRPDPYTGVAKLRAGQRIAIPTTPTLRPGASSGLLIGTLGSPTPSAGPVAVFDASGRLLARFRTPARRPFRLRLAPGRYLLLADNETQISCWPAAARVRADHTTKVSVPSGCDGGSY
jgi:hypothetical protein